jgi:hypothetical protein
MYCRACFGSLIALYLKACLYLALSKGNAFLCSFNGISLGLVHDEAAHIEAVWQGVAYSHDKHEQF